MPPKQVVEIRKFTKGMVTNVDVTDPPIDTPIYTKGLETHNAVGSLSGSPVDEDIFNNLNIVNAESILIDNENLLFAISESGDFYFMEGLYLTPYYYEFDRSTNNTTVPVGQGAIT